MKDSGEYKGTEMCFYITHPKLLHTEIFPCQYFICFKVGRCQAEQHRSEKQQQDGQKNGLLMVVIHYSHSNGETKQADYGPLLPSVSCHIDLVTTAK